MNPKTTKSINLFATVLFTIAGLTCLGLAAYLTVKPAPAKAAQYLAHPVDKVGCMKALQSLGFEVKNEKPVGSRSYMTAHTSDLDSPPKEWVDRASLGIAACHVPLKSFCMGSGCTSSGITFTVEFPE